MIKCAPPLRICVFCGSGKGNNPIYIKTAENLASEMYKSHVELVYGGGNIGLMGVLADRLLTLGGTVTGVIPKKLVEIEVAHTGLTNMHIVEGMHERKALMTKLSDGFIIMPGGIGTMDEFFEIFTWLQLGYHNKPICLLNSGGYYNKLLEFLNHSVTEGFLSRQQLNNVHIYENATDLISAIIQIIN